MSLTAGDIFAGPILRRSSVKSVAIWLAATKSVNLDGRIRKAGSAAWIGETAVVDRLQLFDGLYVYLLQIAPAEGVFPSGTLLEYSLGTIGSDGAADHSWFESIVASDGLAYPGFALPTFYLQALGTKLNVLYASCRKPHDTFGGNNDAMTYGDSITLNNVKTLAARPTILCLTGDQIYADDVHDATFDAIDAIAKKLEVSSPERMPGGTAVPGKGQRQKWIAKMARFTSDAAKSHIVTFAEYVASYGLAWNERNWPAIVPKEVATYRSGLRAVRRLLANTPTYMIFDDHDVTDDWNLSVNWRDEVQHSNVGSRIIANALAAFWLFQAWGNDPEASAGEAPQIRAALLTRLARPEELAAVVGSKSTLNAWEFQTPTAPAVYFIDTRTNRGHLLGFQRIDGRAPAFLKSVEAWAGTLHRLQEIVRTQGHNVPLVLVAPAPVFGYETIDTMQRAISSQVGPTMLDLEGWAANRPHLLLFLTLCADFDVVLLSGDVHYAFTSTASLAVFDGDFVRMVLAKQPHLKLPKSGAGSTATSDFLYSSRFLQLNSSGARNSTEKEWKKALMTRTSMLAGESGYLLKGAHMDPSLARWKNSKLYRWIQQPEPPPAAPPGTWEEVSTADAKPNFVLQQRINDAFNTAYTGEHNLGYASFLGRKVDNGFLVNDKLVSLRSWDFASGSAWVPSLP